MYYLAIGRNSEFYECIAYTSELKEEEVRKIELFAMRNGGAGGLPYYL